MRYETPADLAAEKEIAAAFVATSAKLDGSRKMPVQYILDMAALGGSKVGAFVEIKDRHIAFGQGNGGLHLSLLKVLKAQALKALTALPCYLVVRFSDGSIYRCHLDAFDRERGVFWWGRDGRDEDEPCVAFPWDVFVKVEAP